ncbi:PulJ/GspJ family protein [Paraburkholderia acidisoli]|uniref:Prepilin-type N-terminal cleavage/methylation domain-containing protein n=1 Tax=Paraburkholderia acidisoli TaxID=2571748 RepID=A0A7Z2JEX9_9BURK|nr:prepilin-type N-terminal cleavage/methylation domain-containing protein [Paraburkholderia acidisoli]QGZ62782.1 prepilin-type N-terminal cleavage/methylation domain-containing protein [Paraburkholderia acidisoli]
MKRTDRCDRPRGRARSRRYGARGFTLIELLVAIAILAVVALLAWRGLDQIMRGRDVLTRSMAEERVFAQMFDQMRIDAREAASDDEAAGLAISLEGGALQIVRAFAVPPGAAPRLQVVRYRVQDGQVVRYASPPLANLGQLRSALRGESGNWSALPMMRGVDSISARLYVPKTGWTSNMQDVRAQLTGNNNGAKVPQLGNAPIPRSVTGVQVSVGSHSLAHVVTRIFLVGE